MPILNPPQIAIWRNKLTYRLPAKGRYQRYYARLDELFPRWGEVVGTDDFYAWAAKPDTADGACMIDRLFSLWNDPAYTSDGFATLLRLYPGATMPPQLAKARSWLSKLLDKPVAEPAPHARPTYPVILKHYELLRVLGRGGNGEVYLAWSREITAVVALKLIRAELSIDTEARRSFRREAEMWARLERHPNIAALNFFDDTHDVLHMAIEYVPGPDDHGPSLEDHIAAGRCSLEAMVRWFTHITHGLEHAYSHGLVAHRDLKPGNILVGRDNVARVTDFGLALPRFASSLEHVAAGTPHFMAPEQFDDDAVCDIRSDIYSLGATLFQCVSNGAPVFQPSIRNPTTAAEVARYFAELRDMHRHAAPPRLPSPLWPVIARSLAKDPSARFQTIAGFREAIARAVDGHGVPPPLQNKQIDDMWDLPGRAVSLMRLGQHEDAIALFDRYIAWMPDDNASFDRAVCLERLGRYDEALEVYRRFADKDDAKGYINGANCLRQLGRTREAFAYARRAVEVDEKEPLGWISLGNAAYALELWPDAITAYKLAHHLEPTDATPLYNLGLAADRATDLDLAKKAFAAFLQVALEEDDRRDYVARKLSAWGKRIS
jgi:serine/threonine-protein kinase